MKRVCLILFVSLPFFINAGSYRKVAAKPVAPQMPIVSQIELYDDVTLTMDGNSASAITDNPAVTVTIVDGVMKLRVTAGKEHRNASHHVRWNARDSFSSVNEVRLFGQSSLYADHMKAPTILRHNSSGQVVIKGYVPLALLEQNGGGSTTLSFIDSPNADVLIHNGTANLSGVAERLRYFAEGDAMVDAKALRVGILWAHGQGNSLSFLMPTSQSHAIATGKGQVILNNKTDYFSTLSSNQGEIIYNNLFSLNP